MDQVGVGIVGCGYWGKNYVRVFSELPQARVIQACDAVSERLELIETSFPAVKTGMSLDVLLSSEYVDAVIVATPAGDHYSTVRACLSAGKHVLVEKPLALTIEECEKLIQLSKKRNRILMTGHTFLYNAGVRKMKACIADASFGHMYYLHATRTNLGPIRHDVNVAWDLATHDVAIFNYLLNNLPHEVCGHGARVLGNNKEDVLFVTLRYAENIIANIHVSWVDPNKVRQVVAVSSQKRIVFDDLRTIDRVRIFDKGVSAQPQDTDGFGEFRLVVHDGDIISPKIEPSEPLKNQCIHFLDCIKASKSPLTDGQNGLDVVRVMTAVEESLRQNGNFVNVIKQPSRNSIIPMPQIRKNGSVDFKR